MPRPPFIDRRDAGRQLARHLAQFAGHPDVLVVGLPRGGIPVAFEVAHALHAPLEPFIVRKLGVPGHEEYAMGAIASGGITVLDRDVVDQLGIPPLVVDRVARHEQAELERRQRAYRGARPFPELHGRTVIVIDDGLATGATMAAAVAALRELGPEQIIVAAPVAAPSTCAMLRRSADDCICALTPSPFHGVGLWYEDFAQTTDDEVRALLAEARDNAIPAGAGQT